MIQRVVLCLAVLLSAGPACAQADLFSPGTVSGQIELRVAGAGGERSWVDGDFGKTRVRGGGGGVSVEPYLGEADLVWRPHLTWDLSVVIDAEAQSGNRAGVGTAYLLYKPLPIDGVHYQVRAGLFYPPISLEHEGAAWTVANTITPSAVNSWIGEEVKVAAAEGSLRTTVAGQQIGVTAAVFADNDTAGALMATRGWALDDLKVNTASHFSLPPLGDYLSELQPRFTTPLTELDGRVGGYARLDWIPSNRLALNLLYYDNDGDLTSDDKFFQWAWDTRFWNVGLRYDIDEHTQLLSQGLWGDTKMGFHTPGLWVNVGYRAAYVLVTRSAGDNAVTGRIDYFSTSNHSYDDIEDQGEHGWALTADYRRVLTAHAAILLEAMHVSSVRADRSLAGLSADQSQTVLQAALRLSY